jgi:hypothetical protein
MRPADGCILWVLPRPRSGSDRAGLVGSRSAPTPPARPYFHLSMRAGVVATVRQRLRSGFLNFLQQSGLGGRFLRQNRRAQQRRWPGDELYSGPQRLHRLDANASQQDLAVASATSLLPLRFRGAPLQDREHSQEDGQCLYSDGDRYAARIVCLPPLRWHA